MQTPIKNWQMFVGGDWRDSSDGQTLPVINPATKDVIANIPAGTASDVDEAVRSAHKAFETWSETTPGERSRMLLKLAARIEAHSEEIAVLESQNVGKPMHVALDDVEFSVDNLQFFAGAARNLEGRAAGEYIRGHTSIIRREPVGVVASIAPWNYPLLMASWKIGPALAAGNTVILKPSEITPLTALKLAELAADIFPAGVFNVITGYGVPVGAGLAEHPLVSMVSLTGSPNTGKSIIRAAAATVKRVHMELGGKAPALVLEDADVAEAAAGVRRSGFYNSGQDCTAATRVIAHEKVYERLVADLQNQISRIRVGDPGSGQEIDMGPLVSEAHQERVNGFVERAVAQGAALIAGGERGQGSGYFYQPTLIADVQQNFEVIQQEVFGPAITIQRVGSDEEAVKLANDVPYGLAASVWSTNVGRAMKITKYLQFGTVWVNQHTRLTPEMPHGGYKQSGYGKDMSIYAVEDYTNIKHVMVRLS
jgi:1-pyrroline dehydrogenase